MMNIFGFQLLATDRGLTHWGLHKKDQIVKSQFLKWRLLYLMQISFKFVPKGKMD